MMTSHTPTRDHLHCCPLHDEGEPDYGPDRELEIATSAVARAEYDQTDPADLLRWVIAEEHFKHATITIGLHTTTIEVWDTR